MKRVQVHYLRARIFLFVVKELKSSKTPELKSYPYSAILHSLCKITTKAFFTLQSDYIICCPCYCKTQNVNTSTSLCIAYSISQKMKIPATSHKTQPLRIHKPDMYIRLKFSHLTVKRRKLYVKSRRSIALLHVFEITHAAKISCVYELK